MSSSIRPVFAFKKSHLVQGTGTTGSTVCDTGEKAGSHIAEYLNPQASCL